MLSRRVGPAVYEGCCAKERVGPSVTVLLCSVDGLGLAGRCVVGEVGMVVEVVLVEVAARHVELERRRRWGRL